jgi:hypothetical protein
MSKAKKLTAHTPFDPLTPLLTPSKCPSKWLIKWFSHQKKIISKSFLNSGTLVFLCTRVLLCTVVVCCCLLLGVLVCCCVLLRPWSCMRGGIEWGRGWLVTRALPPPPPPTTIVRYTWVHAVGGGGLELHKIWPLPGGGLTQYWRRKTQYWRSLTQYWRRKTQYWRSLTQYWRSLTQYWRRKTQPSFPSSFLTV